MFEGGQQARRRPRYRQSTGQVDRAASSDCGRFVHCFRMDLKSDRFWRLAVVRWSHRPGSGKHQDAAVHIGSGTAGVGSC
jgi:hypothetical protein